MKESYETYYYYMSRYILMEKVFLNEPVKINRRKQRTEEKLYNALLAAYQDQDDFNRIEIKAFCERAGVSRATFYRLHPNLADVLLAQFVRLISRLAQQINALNQVDFESWSTVAVSEIEDHLVLFKLVKWAGVQESVEALLSETILKGMAENGCSTANQQFVSQFIGSSLLQFARQVAENPTPLTRCQTLALYRRLMPKVE